jgi:glycosyltransferase involved in cell wall biosynthesis
MTSVSHKNLLFIGPEYKNHRGGIGAVLEVYARHIRPFKFIPTFKPGGVIKKLFTYIIAVFSLLITLARDRDIKIVHIHSASKASFLRKSFVILICRLFGKKVVYHLHGGKFHIFYQKAGITRRYIRYIIESCDAVICLSDHWRDYLQSTFKIKRLEVVKNVIEAAPASDIGVNRNGGPLRLLFLGMITEGKGIFDLLDVLKVNSDTLNGRVTLTVGGNGDVEGLKRAMQSFGKGEIEFAGWVNGEKKKELLANCDIYILPSYNEGLPMSILEAMTFGKPIISTPVGGIPEVVKPGFNGWLFKPGDREALTKIIFEALEHEERLATYGKNSLALSSNYLPDAVFSLLDTLYSRLIK